MGLPIVQGTLTKRESIHYMGKFYEEHDLIQVINELEEMIFG